MNVKQDDNSISEAVGYNETYFGTLGSTWQFYIRYQNFIQQSNHQNNNFDAYPHGSDYLTGSSDYEDQSDVELEVFQIEC